MEKKVTPKTKKVRKSKYDEKLKIKGTLDDVLIASTKVKNK